MICSNKKFGAITRWLAMVATLAAPPAFAEGECLQWDVSGTWHIVQSNGTNVLMKIQQTGANVQGVAEYSSYNDDAGKVETVGGPVNGVFEPSGILRVTAYWSNSTAGLYTGQVGPDGAMSGYAVDKNDSGNKATFRASGWPKCLSRAAIQPPPPPAAPAGPTVPANRLVHVHRENGPAPTLISICESARSAKTRNSPAAPGLEKQCLAGGGSMTPPPPPTATPPLDAGYLDALAVKGGPIAQSDPLASALRAQQSEGAAQRGFDIGLAAAENDTAPGPGKAHIHDSLGTDAQPGYTAAVAYLLERNRNKELASKGASIAAQDPFVANARGAEASVFYQLGFDIATGLFGDPALGALGSTLMGPGSMKIHDSLGVDARRGFNASLKFHLARGYAR